MAGCSSLTIFIGALHIVSAWGKTATVGLDGSHMLDQLGGMVPPEVVVTPIVVSGAVSAVFYGDNLPGGHPITSIHGLELLMIEAGLAIERNVLAEKLSWLEQTMSAISGDKDEG